MMRRPHINDNYYENYYSINITPFSPDTLPCCRNTGFRRYRGGIRGGCLPDNQQGPERIRHASGTGRFRDSVFRRHRYSAQWRCYPGNQPAGRRQFPFQWFGNFPHHQPVRAGSWQATVCSRKTARQRDSGNGFHHLEQFQPAPHYWWVRGFFHKNNGPGPVYPVRWWILRSGS